jgi:hypothetical protein
MYVNPFQISLETLIGAAPLLGHRLEDRSGVRDAQDGGIVRKVQAVSSVRLRDPSQHDLFCVAPLDVLVTESNGRKQFHIIEINGTGIGGLTNLPGAAVSGVLDGLCGWAQRLPAPDALVLVASSGKEADAAPRLNKLLHEKILYAEALKRGFDFTGRPADVLTTTQLAQDPAALGHSRPAIVLGYMKEFLEHLTVDAAGTLHLFGRRVHAAVNDRFCLNVVQHFADRFDPASWQTMNRCYLAGADKGAAYALLNDYLRCRPQPSMPTEVPFARAATRQELIATVLDWLRAGRRPVIKPRGTGLGHGIEFFLSPTESPASIVARIDRSLRETEVQYRLPGGALPYTVCEYLDTSTIARPGHSLCGHKFELRVVVYHDGGWLKAFPSIAKVASEAYDPARPSHLSLINNITTSAQAKQSAGVEFMLPLANRATLELLGLTQAEIEELCSAATGFMRFVLDRVQDEAGYPSAVSRAIMSAKAGYRADSSRRSPCR